MKANCCIQTSIYERTYRPEGREDQELGHYDIIRNTDPYHGNHELIQSDSDIGQVYTHGAYSTNVKSPLDHSVSTRERGNGTGESSASGSFISKRSVQTSMGDANEYIKPSDSLPELDIIKEDAMPPLPSSKDTGHVCEHDAINENAKAKSFSIITEDAMPPLPSSKDTGHVCELDAIHENAAAKSIGIIKDAMPPLPSSKGTAHVCEHGAINENADASRTDSLSDDTDKNDYMRPLASKCNNIIEEESKCRSNDDDSKCASDMKEDLKHTTMDIEQDSEHDK